MLTRKHYEAIAEILSEHKDDSQYSTVIDERRVESISLSLADYFEKDNPRFDRDRFLEACGVE